MEWTICSRCPLAAEAKGDALMWDAHLKLKFIGKWWKISLLCNIAKLLRLETELYSGGTGRGGL
jgi:hypothetical protein